MKRTNFLALFGVLAIAAALTLVFGSPAEASGLAHTLGDHSLLMLANAPVVAAITKGDIEALNTQIAEVGNQVKNFAEDINKKIETGATVTAELKEKADKGLSDLGELRGRIQELEQKAARPAAPEQDEASQTPGTRFVANDKVKQFMADRLSRGRVRVDMAAITSSPNSAGAAIPQAMRVPGFVALPERRMTVRDLLTPGRTSQNAIQFVVETGFTNNAAHVSEGATKPQSNITFDLVTKSVATIAHWMLASKQVLDDAPMLSSHIDGRLRYGLAYVEEDQLLNGDGTGTNIHGIIPQATDYNPAFQAQAETMIDKVRLALLQSELAEFPATGIVLNPVDWTRIELTKDGENRYIFAQPQSVATPRLWNRPVVATQAMEVDEFLTGAFQLGAQVFDREDANVEISTEDSDNFRKNLITIRAEERLVLAVYRPEAFVIGDFGNVSE